MERIMTDDRDILSIRLIIIIIIIIIIDILN